MRMDDGNVFGKLLSEVKKLQKTPLTVNGQSIDVYWMHITLAETPHIDELMMGTENDSSDKAIARMKDVLWARIDKANQSGSVPVTNVMTRAHFDELFNYYPFVMMPFAVKVIGIATEAAEGFQGGREIPATQSS